MQARTCQEGWDWRLMDEVAFTAHHVTIAKKPTSAFGEGGHYSIAIFGISRRNNSNQRTLPNQRLTRQMNSSFVKSAPSTNLTRQHFPRMSSRQYQSSRPFQYPYAITGALTATSPLAVSGTSFCPTSNIVRNIKHTGPHFPYFLNAQLTRIHPAPTTRDFDVRSRSIRTFPSGTQVPDHSEGEVAIPCWAISPREIRGYERDARIAGHGCITIGADWAASLVKG